jgi:hypothetical protein
MYFKQTEYEGFNLMTLAQDSFKWRDIVKIVMKIIYDRRWDIFD